MQNDLFNAGDLTVGFSLFKREKFALNLHEIEINLVIVDYFWKLSKFNGAPGRIGK